MNIAEFKRELGNLDLETCKALIKILNKACEKAANSISIPCTIYSDWFVIPTSKIKELEASEGKLNAREHTLDQIISKAIGYKRSQGFKAIDANLTGADFPAPPVNFYGSEFDSEDRKVMLSDYDLLMLACKFPITFAERISRFNAGLEDVEASRKKAYKNHRQAIERWDFPSLDRQEKYNAKVKY